MDLRRKRGGGWGWNGRQRGQCRRDAGRAGTGGERKVWILGRWEGGPAERETQDSHEDEEREAWFLVWKDDKERERKRGKRVSLGIEREKGGM